MSSVDQRNSAPFSSAYSLSDTPKLKSLSSLPLSVLFGLWPVAHALSRAPWPSVPTEPSNCMTRRPSRSTISVSQSIKAPDSFAHTFTRS